MARVQIRGPRSLFAIKRHNNTYDVTHFSYFDSTFVAGMLKIQIVALISILIRTITTKLILEIYG